jgi:hypothetical protein
MGRTCHGDLSCWPPAWRGRRAIRKVRRRQGRLVEGRGGTMEQADIDRVRRVLRQRPSPPGGCCGAAGPCTYRRAAAAWGRGHGAGSSCRRVGSCCGPSGCAVTLPRSTTWLAVGVAATATPRSWPTISSAVTSAMPIPRWRSARSAAEPSTGPTAYRISKAEDRSSVEPGRGRWAAPATSAKAPRVSSIAVRRSPGC